MIKEKSNFYLKDYPNDICIIYLLSLIFPHFSTLRNQHWRNTKIICYEYNYSRQLFVSDEIIFITHIFTRSVKPQHILLDAPLHFVHSRIFFSFRIVINMDTLHADSVQRSEK